MRDERNTDHFDQEDRRPRRRRRSAFDALESVFLLGTLALIALPAIKGIARRYRVRNPIAADNDHVDESLKETFPASDPPASRFVDIPANRRN
jgi:hypothetical protein